VDRTGAGRDPLVGASPTVASHNPKVFYEPDEL
jgi:hypothetical protein